MRCVVLLFVLPLVLSDQLTSEDFCLFKFNERYCLSIIKANRTFMDANEECRKLGKVMLTINSKNDQKTVVQTLGRVVGPNVHVWFGLHSLFNRYRWMSGAPVLNTYISPSNESDHRDCFSLYAGNSLYTWTPSYCNVKLWFLCGPKPARTPSSITNLGTRGCPDEFLLVGNRCFHLRLDQRDARTWTPANQFCAGLTKNGSVATISSLLEQDYLSVSLSRSSGPAWIGLRLYEGEHRWISNENMSFSNWIPKQPAGGERLQCTLAHQRPVHLGQWEDVDCREKLGFVCEAPLMTIGIHQNTGVSKILSDRGSCRVGFVEFHGRCYRLILMRSAQTGEGSNTLNRKDCPMRLAPHSSEELALMRLLLNSQPESVYDFSWIGVTFYYTTGTQQSLRFEAEDGLPVPLTSALDFSLFPPATNIKTSDNQPYNCVAVSRTSMDLVWMNCSTLLPSICGYPLPGYELEASNFTACPLNWISLGKKCYSDIIYPALTWPGAEAYCQQLHEGSHLVSLHSPAEQQYLSSLVSHRRAWIGLRVQPPAVTQRGVRYQWSDDSVVDYLSFGLGQPSFEMNNGEVEECVILHPITSDWNDVSCYDRHPFVCQLSLSNKVEAAPSPSTTSAVFSHEVCSLTKPVVCIELYSKPLTYWTAQDECERRNRTLVTIPSRSHQKFIHTTLDKLTGGSPIKAYIGLFASSGNWLWTSDYQSLPSTFWSNGYPSGRNSCVYIDTAESSSQSWKTESCDEPFSYLCANTVSTILTAATDFTQHVCPNNYTRVGSSCFKIQAGLEDQLTWHEASEVCATTSPEATLATVSSIHEQDGLTALLGLQANSAWIGLILVDGSHTWQRADPIVYTNWDIGEPSGHGTRCTSMSRQYDRLGDWRNSECDQRMGYVCQTNPVPSTTTKLVPDLEGLFITGRCSTGFYEYRDQCFTLSMRSEQFSRSSTVLRDTISGQCLSMSNATGAPCGQNEVPWGTLLCPVVATPHTHADAAFLRNLVSTFGMNIKDAWVGLKVRSNDGSFQVVSEDESVLGASSLIAFNPKVLSTSATAENSYSCLTVSTLDLGLKGTNCTSVGLPVVCGYYLADHPLHPAKRALYTEHCPPEWTSLGGNCYLAPQVASRLNWSAAEVFCQSVGLDVATQTRRRLSGHLVSVHSLEEQHLIAELAPASSIWIGLHSSLMHGQHPLHVDHGNRSVHLTWTDGSPVDYLSLESNELALVDGQSDCFAVGDRDPHWHSVECHQSKSFICQLSASDQYNLSAISEKGVATSVTCDQTFPLLSKSGHDCYRIIQTAVDWAGAEAVCRNLEKDAHLASIHSKQELDDLVRLIKENLHNSSNVWLGLTESELAYRWSDGSVVDFIPVSADESKDQRHLSQDCFALLSTPETAERTSLHLRAANCTDKLTSLVCQRGSSITVPSVVSSDPSSWKPLVCPTGYRQYADRCFSLLSTPYTWADANLICSETAEVFYGYSGSLARIDSTLLQDFVSSLLDDLPEGSASAWIGLQRDLSDDAPNVRWSDGTTATFLRSIYRAHSEPIFKFVSISGILQDGMNVKMCTALYRSTYPRLNGLWLQWSCDDSVRLPGICQAIPSNNANMDAIVPPPISFDCPIGFSLGTTGFSTSLYNKISHPVCYHVLSSTEKLDWVTSSERCKALSTDHFNVSLVSVASVFESSFLRSWLRLPQDMGGAGIPANEPVWSALSVTDRCPECYANWTWETHEDKPVRYTDWLSPPSPTPSGCYLFYPNPFTLPDSMVDSGLGSLQPADSCAMNYIAVCQTLTKQSDDQRLTDEASQSIFTTHQLVRPPCTDFQGLSRQVSGTAINSRTGKPCIRWDLIPSNSTNFRLELNAMRHRLDAAEVVGGGDSPSYAENYCSLLYDPVTRKSDYGCYVQLNPLIYEACDSTSCHSGSLVAPQRFSPVATFFVVLLCLAIVGVVTFGVWRYHAPLRVGYTRYLSHTFKPKRPPTSTVHFFTPPKLGVPESDAPSTLNGYAAHGSEAVTSSHTTNTGTQSTSHSALHSDSVAVSYSLDLPVGSMGYVNPFYTSLVASLPEDDYEPEVEL